MELQQVRYVVAIAEERNFTRAAERCFVVQSSLSHQVKALERELGVTLFARTSRRVELTASGAAFVEQARATLAAADRAVSEAAAASGQVRGSLTVGIIPTVTAIDLPAALGLFHRTHPAVRSALTASPSDASVAAIGAGTMDIAVLGLADSTPPTGVESRVLARERLVAVVGASHPLARRRRVRLPELAAQVFVDFPAGAPGRVQSDLAFQAAGLRRDVAFEVESASIMLELAAQGFVVALLPPAVVPANRDDLRAVQVTGGPTRIEYLAWSSFNASPATSAFLECVAVR